MPHQPKDKAAAEQLRKIVGRGVRTARERLGWSQERLAEVVGVGAEMLGRYERGLQFPSHVTFLRLTATLGVSADALYGIAHETPAAALPDDTVRALLALNPRELALLTQLLRVLTSPHRVDPDPSSSGRGGGMST
jgi:transcriptional regulator with XRE-family HTH domain